MAGGDDGAAVIHATAELEARHIRTALGAKCPPVIVAPNGVVPPNDETSECTENGESLRRLLFLSRIHEKKGVLDLIRAFGAIEADGWELVIAGNDDGGHQRLCEQLAAQQPNAWRIRFPGPVSDADYEEVK